VIVAAEGEREVEGSIGVGRGAGPADKALDAAGRGVVTFMPDA
jgi:hypothetical protein